MSLSFTSTATAAFALFFATAVVGKTAAWAGWRSLADRIGPSPLGPAVAFGVPAAEAAVVVACVTKPAVGLASASLLLLAFSAGVVLQSGRLRGEDCNCFGPFLRSRIGPRLAARNAVFGLAAAAAAVAAYRAGTGPLSVADLARAGVLLAPVAATAWVVATNRRGRVGPRVGSRQDVRGLDGPALVVFVAPGCPACEQVIDELPAHRERARPVEVVAVVVEGDPGERAGVLARLGTAARVDLQGLVEQWDISGTPFAVALDGSGRVAASGIAAPQERLEELAAAALGREIETAPGDLVPKNRREFIVTLAQGLALLAVPSLASAAVRSPGWTPTIGGRRRVAEDTNPGFSNDKRNVSRTNHCNKFADRLDRGVFANGHYLGKDANGSPIGGYTSADGLEDDSPNGWQKAHAKVCKQTEAQSEEWRGHCTCDNQIYYKESVCKAECPKGLKCFGKQCVTDYRRICIEAMIDVCVSVPSITVSVLKWKPTKKSRRVCRDTAGAYNEAVTAHELRHVDDINRTVDDVNQDFTNQSVRGCGPTAAAARAALNAEIQKVVDRAKKELWTLDRQRAAELHASDSGGSTVLDCQPCP